MEVLYVKVLMVAEVQNLVFRNQETGLLKVTISHLPTGGKKICQGPDFKSQNNTRVWNHDPRAAAKSFTVLRLVRQILGTEEPTQEPFVRIPNVDKMFTVRQIPGETQFTGGGAAELVQTLRFTTTTHVLSLRPIVFVHRPEEILPHRNDQEVSVLRHVPIRHPLPEQDQHQAPEVEVLEEVPAQVVVE